MPRRTQILLVEDDKPIRDLLAARLDQTCELTVATCQKEALDLLAEHKKKPVFDLVLLDLKLPRRAGDMNMTTEAGTDLLKEIRRRRLVKANSQRLLPVVVMTAHGTQKVALQLLLDVGADDYIPKPFGDGRDLREKIKRALVGGAALIPAANMAATIVRLAFHDHGKVRIEDERLTYEGAHYDLLAALRDPFLEDQAAQKSPQSYRRIPGDVLAERLHISDHALRQRVRKFRREVAADFTSKLERAIGKDDIIDNIRDRKGYRLNPLTVRLVAWTELSTGTD